MNKKNIINLFFLLIALISLANCFNKQDYNFPLNIFNIAV